MVRTVSHASSLLATPYGASLWEDAVGTSVIGVPENLPATTSRPAKTVGATSIFVTMPARRVVLEMTSRGVAALGSLPNVAIMIGASKKPLRSTAVGGD